MSYGSIPTIIRTVEFTQFVIFLYRDHPPTNWAHHIFAITCLNPLISLPILKIAFKISDYEY